MTINGSNNDRFLSVKERTKLLFESAKNPTAIENSPTAIKTNEVVKQRSNTQPPPMPKRIIQKPTSTVSAQTQKAEASTSLSSPSLAQKPTQTVPAQAQKAEISTPQSSSPLTQSKPIQTVPAQAQKAETSTPPSPSSPTQLKPTQTAPAQVQKTETPPSSPFLRLRKPFDKFFGKKSTHELERPLKTTPQPAQQQPAPDQPAQKLPYTPQPILIIQARASVVPSKEVKPQGDFIEGKWTQKFDQVQKIVFHHQLVARIFSGGGVLKIGEEFGDKTVLYFCLVGPKAFQHWLSQEGHLKKESPHILCFLEIGRESEVKHDVAMLKHDSARSDKTAPQARSVDEKDHYKYVLISKDKMDRGLQSVQLLKKNPKKAFYNENAHYSGTQSPLLLAEIKKTLGL